MGGLTRIGYGALLGAFGLLVVVGCNDEKKPPLTPDGPEMTAPVGGGDGGADMPAPPGSATPPAK